MKDTLDLSITFKSPDEEEDEESTSDPDGGGKGSEIQ